MAGTFLGKSLADGQVASSAGDLYTVPASTVAYIKKAIFTNINAAARSLTIYLTRSGSSDREIAHADTLAQHEGLEIENLVLSDGDKIRAVASAATSVDYVIM